MRPNTCIRFFAALLVGTLSQAAFSQQQANIFYFGTAGLDFGTDPPTVLTNSAMDAHESPAVMCDSLGNLLFYTNGGNHPLQPYNGAIWNRNHAVMENGELYDTAGCSSTFQGALFVPFPGSATKYYLFTKDCLENNYNGDDKPNRGLRYSVIDLSYNGGLGKVTEKGVPVVPFLAGDTNSTGYEPLTAVQHANGRDYWVFFYVNDAICSFLADPWGFQPLVQQGYSGTGRIVVSPRRDYVLFGKDLYTLDAASGDIGYLRSLDCASAEFSPDGRFLYTTQSAGSAAHKLWQHDLAAADFDASAVLVASGADWMLSLAPNGKIYNWRGYRTYLSGVISCPNEPGLDCGFHADPTDLGGRMIGAECTHVLTHYLFRDSLPCAAPPTPPAPAPPVDLCTFGAYPNPSSGLVTVVLADSAVAVPNLSVCDAAGRLVADYGTVPGAGYTFSTAEWAPGVYVVSLWFNREKQCRTKIVVENF